MAATTLRTTCIMDCPDACSLDVAVTDGKIERIGAADGGFICDKVARFDRRVYHEDRLLFPLRRVGPKGGGSFERISWDEAITEITSRFQKIIARWGGEAILPYHYGGSNGVLGDGFLDHFYFAKLGASRLGKTICSVPSSEVATGMYGKMPGVAFEDFPEARCIIIWGANPKASNIHLTPFLRQAKRNGAFIAVVDPVCNFTPNEIDLHIPVFPGADLPVALAMIRLWKEAGRLDRDFLAAHADGLDQLLQQAGAWTLERAAAEARVSPEDIGTLARTFADAAPALIRCGWGLERNRNGGQAIAAILAMPALLGKFGVRGGGYTLSNGATAKLDSAKVFGPYEWKTRVVNMTQLGAVLAGDREPPVKGLFVYNCNPAVTVPDQNAILKGLADPELFTVVFEQVMTDTAEYADIVLPNTTFFEQYEFRRSYGSYLAGGMQPVIEARGESKPNEWVFAALGRAMGWTDAPFQWDSLTAMRKAVEAFTLFGRPLDFNIMAAGGTQGYDFPGPRPVQFKTTFPLTADGKIHLTPPVLGPKPFEYRPVTRENFPLALVSPANNKMITSMLGEFNYPELWLMMHPLDAKARNIADEDEVRVYNDLGEVICRTKLSGRIRQGVVSLPKGAWRKSSRNGQTSTALCPQDVSDVGGAACYNDARVQVAKHITS